MPSPTIILSILLALSVAGNAWLFNSRDKALAREATTEQARKDTAIAAQACSNSVDELARKGVEQHDAVLASLKANAGKVAKLEGATIAALNAKPADPNDLCKSLALYLRGEIQAKKTGGAK